MFGIQLNCDTLTKIAFRAFCDRVQPIEGALDLLLAAGFVQQKMDNNGVVEEFLVFKKENVASIESLTVGKLFHSESILNKP